MTDRGRPPARWPRTFPWWLLALLGIAWATLSPQPGTRPRAFSWCLDCEAHWLGDLINNVALFIPLGVTLALRGSRVARAVLLGVATSCAVELLQRIGIAPGRIPALSDVVMNGLGTALGAWGMHRLGGLRRTIWQVSATRARWLLLGHTAVVGGMLWSSAWSAQSTLAVEAGATHSAQSPVVADSWVNSLQDQDFVQSAIQGSVNGAALRVKHTGQIIAAVSGTDTVTLRIDRRLIDEKDRRDRPIALVYVHGTRTRDELVYLGQEGDDLLLRSTVRATALGLQTPTLRLRGVFALDTALTGSTSQIVARVSPGSLSLRIHVPDARIGSRYSEMLITPALGWAILQPLIGASAAMAPLLTCLWLACWFIPGGVWSARSGGVATRRTARGILVRGGSAVLWSAAVLLVGVYAATTIGVHQLPWWQIASAMAGAIVGVVVEVRGHRGVPA
jgi:VanZ family protein